MIERISAVLLACVLAFATGFVRAEEPKPADDAKKPPEKKPAVAHTPGRIFRGGPLIEDLRTKAELSDADIAKAKESVAVVEKKYDEIMAREEVKAADEEMKKAQAALAAAQLKSNAAKDNFNYYLEVRKAVYEAVPDEKKDKAGEVLRYNPKAEKKAVVAPAPPVAAPAPAPSPAPAPAPAPAK